MKFQFRTDNDDRSARVIDTLAEQILTETSAFAFEHVAQRFQRAIARASDGAAVTAVVEQCVDRLLQHTFLVANDNVRRLEHEQVLKPVVTIDDTTIQIVQVRCREPTAFEGN